MKKIFIIVALALIITGCNAEYNLVINEDNFKESLTIDSEYSTSFDIKQLMESHIEAFYQPGKEVYSGIKSDQLKYYNKKKTGHKIEIDYEFSNDNYYSSNIINNCFKDVSIVTDDNNYYLHAKEFLCFDKYPKLTGLTINITFDRFVINHNALFENDLTYTWMFKKTDNQSTELMIDFPIEPIMEKYDEACCDGSADDLIAEEGEPFDFEKEYLDWLKEDDEDGANITSSSKHPNTNEEKSMFIIYVILGVIVVAIGVTIFVVIKNKKNNKI